MYVDGRQMDGEQKRNDIRYNVAASMILQKCWAYMNEMWSMMGVSSVYMRSTFISPGSYTCTSNIKGYGNSAWMHYLKTESSREGFSRAPWRFRARNSVPFSCLKG